MPNSGTACAIVAAALIRFKWIIYICGTRMQLVVIIWCWGIMFLRVFGCCDNLTLALKNISLSSWKKQHCLPCSTKSNNSWLLTKNKAWSLHVWKWVLGVPSNNPGHWSNRVEPILATPGFWKCLVIQYLPNCKIGDAVGAKKRILCALHVRRSTPIKLDTWVVHFIIGTSCYFWI